MRKRFEWKWEQLDPNTWRAKVIGGWIVSNYTWEHKESGCPQIIGQSTCFIKDPEHEWQITSAPAPKDELPFEERRWS